MLVSGSGTLLESMLATGIPVSVAVADRPCRGLEIADRAGVGSLLLERETFDATFDRTAYSRELARALIDREIELVAMAGFGTILAQPMFDAFPNRIINTHPALLPSFPGWHAVRDALAYGVKVTGCTIHVATPVVDDGPILAQEAVSVRPEDDEPSLHERIKIVERRLYIETIKTILERQSVLELPSAQQGVS